MEINNAAFTYGAPYGGINRPFQAPQPKMTQLLSAEELNMLKSKAGAFNINVDPMDLIKSRCVHRENGQFAVQEIGDGKLQCMICGEVFTPIYDNSGGEIEAAIQKVLDIMNTIKLTYLDMPVEMGNEFMPIMELLRKILGLYRIATNDFNRYTNIMDQPVQNQNGGYGNAFANLAMVTNGYQMAPPMGGYPYGGYMGAPQMQYGYQMAPMGAPAMYDPNQMQFASGQPTPANIANVNATMAPSFAPQQVPPQQNPFTMGYMPQQPQAGFQFAAMPTQQAPNPTPAMLTAPQPYTPQVAVPAPPTTSTVVPTAAPSGEVTVTETLHV